MVGDHGAPVVSVNSEITGEIGGDKQNFVMPEQAGIFCGFEVRTAMAGEYSVRGIFV
jgi:hypothetical protein